MAVTQIDALRFNAEIDAGKDSLRLNDYPGRVAIMGLSANAELVVQAYALTGRSDPSKRRIFINDEGSVRTVAPGMTAEEMATVPDAALIYYQAMMSKDGVNVVSNGAQTPFVLHGILGGASLEEAVKAAPRLDDIDLSQYEPDANHTPRITGVVDLRDKAPTPFGLTVVRMDLETAEPIYSSYEIPGAQYLFQKGLGFGIQTYNGNSDGLLPSFDQEPYAFPIASTAAETAANLWDTLVEDKRAAVVARAISLETHQVVETVFIDNYENLAA